MVRALSPAPLVLCALLSVATPVRAQNSAGLAAAEALFEEGRIAMAEGNLEVACERFRASDRLDPAPGTRLNLAECEERRGRLATARSLFRSAAAELEPSDDRLAIARQRADLLEARVPKIKLVLAPGAPQNTTASIDGAEFSLGSFGVPLPMDPGSYSIEVRAPGREQRIITVELVAGSERELQIAPGPSLESELPPVAEAPEPRASGSNTGWIVALATLGVAGAATGGITGVMALEKKDEAEPLCDDELKLCTPEGKEANDAGRKLGVVSTIGFVVGAVGLGGAFYLWVSEPDDPASARVKAKIGPQAGSVSFEQRF